MKKMSAPLKFEEAGAPPQTPLLNNLLKQTTQSLFYRITVQLIGSTATRNLYERVSKR